MKINKQTITTLINAKKSSYEIAKELNISISQVYRLLKLYGLESKSPNTRLRWHTDNLSLLETYLNEGKTYKEIGQIFGVTKQAIEQANKTYLNKDLNKRRKKSNRFTPEEWRVHSMIRPSLGRNELSVEDFKPLPKYCPILGIELDYIGRGKHDAIPSLDRLNNSLGYTKENTILCSWRANRIKNNGTAEEHQKIADFMKNNILT